MKRREEEMFTSVSSHVTYILREVVAEEGRPSAQAPGVHLPFEDGWGDMIHWATVFQNRKDRDNGDCLEIEIVPCN